MIAIDKSMITMIIGFLPVLGNAISAHGQFVESKTENRLSKLL
jgi:hypothetical protein